ncbi:GNAT family N-acetyltransferase [Thermopirellula anaerolimosa]
MPQPYAIRTIAHGSAAYAAELALRKKVLRDPLGLEFTQEELRTDARSIHLGCFQDDRLLGCLVLTPGAGGDVRMRQVAVLPELQGRGIGTALVTTAEALAREKGFRRMVLHARQSAVPFYQRLGYRTVGEPFTEVGLPHRQMEKALAHACNVAYRDRR